MSEQVGRVISALREAGIEQLRESNISAKKGQQAVQRLLGQSPDRLTLVELLGDPLRPSGITATVVIDKRNIEATGRNGVLLWALVDLLLHFWPARSLWFAGAMRMFRQYQESADKKETPYIETQLGALGSIRMTYLWQTSTIVLRIALKEAAYAAAAPA
jgi:hypothetical protein